MRLHKCRNVENYLIEENMIDERRIWCYAQIKASVPSRKVYGLVLVCVKCGELFIYNTEYNSTKLELFYSCYLNDMTGVSVEKRMLTTRLSFADNSDSFILDMDDWTRFSGVFKGEV